KRCLLWVLDPQEQETEVGAKDAMYFIQVKDQKLAAFMDDKQCNGHIYKSEGHVYFISQNVINNQDTIEIADVNHSSIPTHSYPTTLTRASPGGYPSETTSLKPRVHT
ncbi:3941_t:CDS:1, partial [Acaulospora colombiana]